MTDIVGRLWSCGIKDKVVIDAANQIEFLRQRVQELEKERDYWKAQTAHYIDAMPTEKDTEERIKYWRDTIRGELVVHYEKLLSEGQAREAKLRGLLEFVLNTHFCTGDDGDLAREDALHFLAKPQDDSALQEALKQVTEDDPEWDATDYAHPAWWRGHEYTTKAFCNHVNDILDGKDNGAGSNNEPWGSTRKRLLVTLKQARKEALLEAADQIRIDADVQGSIERHIKMWLRKMAEEQK